MKEELRQKLLAKFPEWHKQPLRLSIAEIEDPYSVLEYFFECYSLLDARVCLKELLNDSLRAENVEAGNHLSTHADVEKLVEAAWVIHHQTGNDTAARRAYPEKNDYLAEENTSNEIGYCYEIINGFFDAFRLPYARKYILSALQAAESDKVWQKRSPADLIYFFECLEAIIPAVFILTKSDYRSTQVVLPVASGFPDLTHCHLYCGTYDRHTSWEYFPRSLNSKEYFNPYKALKKFTLWSGKKGWKQIFHDILSHALGDTPLSELGVNLQLVRVGELIQKMLDACHLINVRISIKAGGETNND